MVILESKQNTDNKMLIKWNSPRWKYSGKHNASIIHCGIDSKERHDCADL